MRFFNNIWDNIGGWFRKSMSSSSWGWRPFSPRASYNDTCTEEQKLEMVLQSPALLKVIALQCDLFSLGEVFVYRDDENIEDDPFLKLIKNPNPFQQKSQLLWDFMFWDMLGNAYCYAFSKVIDTSKNRLYMLDPRKIEFPDKMINDADKIILSQAAEREWMRQEITYRYEDGTSIKIPLENIAHVADLSTGISGWLKGPSRINALYKVIANSEATLDSTNINVRYTGKFLVSPGYPAAVDKAPLGKEEQTDLREKIDDGRPVHPLKTMIDIKRFVENIAALKLDERYLHDYFLIGNMYNIPRDVLEAYNSATYENQEKARGAHVAYCLQPKGNEFMNVLEKMFGYQDEGKNIYIDWSHLPFMQVFEKDRAEKERVKADTLLRLIKAGVPLDEINKFLDTEFSEVNYNANVTLNEGTGREAESGEGEKGEDPQERGGRIKAIKIAGS